MSTLKVNKIIPVGGVDSGGGGGIVQVKQTLKTDVFTTNTEDSFLDITGLSVNITPLSSSNKVLVSVNTNISNGSDNLMNFRLLRGSTEIGSDTFGTSINSFGMYDNESLAGTKSRGIGYIVAEILDSPNTTSQITYKVQVRKNGSGNMHVNRRALNTGAGMSSTITVYEVSA